MHRGEPHAGHHKLLNDIRNRCTQAEGTGISKIEIISLLAQQIGRLISELDPNAYDAGEVMRSVALNIASGNQDESTRGLIGTGKPS